MGFHKNMADDDMHSPYIVATGDPGTAAGAHRVWLHPTTGKRLRRNATNDGWLVDDPKHNLTATTDPTVNDDASQGYSIGSMWVNGSADTIFFCADATVGAAVWVTHATSEYTDTDAKEAVQPGSHIYAATATGNDTYVISLTPAIADYTEGMLINFKVDVGNTGAASLNVNGKGAKAIKKLHDQDVETGDIEAGQIVTVVYDGTNFQMQSQLAQAPAGGVTDHGALTGLADDDHPQYALASGGSIYAASATGNDSYAVTLSPAPAALVAGLVVNFKAGTANTGACTLNVNALGDIAIKKLHDQDPATGDIEAGQIVTVIYDGTVFQMQSQIAQTPAGSGIPDPASPEQGDILYRKSDNSWGALPHAADDTYYLRSGGHGADPSWAVPAGGGASTAVTNKTDTYNVQAGDLGTMPGAKVFTMNAATAKTFNLPSVGSGDIGKSITFVRLGAGSLTIDAADSDKIGSSGAGDTIYNDVSIEAGWANVTLLLVTETQWMIYAADGTWISTD